MSEPRQRPFYKPDPLGWPEIAAALSKPWPEAAIAHDLVWWADQVAVGRVAKMPGAVTLAARWGLSRHSRRVRLALGYIVAPESPVCCAGAGASVARGWRAAGASVAHFIADSDDCTSPAGASLAHDWRTGGASVAHDIDGQSDEEPAYTAASDAAPRAHATEPRSQIPEPNHTNTNARTPAQAFTTSPDAAGRAGVDEAGPVPEQVPERRPLPIQPVPRLPIAPPPAPPSAEAPHPMLVKRPGALGVHPEQREASLAAVHEAPVSRGTRNLTLVDGPPKRPPVYRVGGKELPGALSELLPPTLSRLLAPHFRGDEWRSGTQKLFEATDLRFLPGASSEGVRVDLALHFDRVWGIRPKALAAVEVPYVAYGVNAREDLERLWTHRKGVCPDKDALIQLVPDDDRRKAMIAELRALGGAQVDGPGWRALSAAMQARQAAK